MANRVASIVVRTQGPKRNWVAANGKTDPPGTYYIRWCEGKTNRFAKAGASYAEAEIAQMRIERKLKAASIGAIIPEEAPDPKAHRIADVITEYLADLSDSRRPLGSIKSKKTELQAFAKFCRKTYVEEIKRTDLIAYRNSIRMIPRRWRT